MPKIQIVTSIQFSLWIVLENANEIAQQDIVLRLFQMPLEHLLVYVLVSPFMNILIHRKISENLKRKTRKNIRMIKRMMIGIVGRSSRLDDSEFRNRRISKKYCDIAYEIIARRALETRVQ